MTWRIAIAQPNYCYQRAQWVMVDHCPTVTDAVRTAQRAYPGWTALYAERLS